MEVLATVDRPAPPIAMIADAESPSEPLVARARGGDVTAFEELYQLTCGRIYALCLRMCGDAHVAEELTQESYLKAWQKLATFRGDSLFATWLHRIAVNVVLGHHRTRLRRGERPAEEGELETIPAPCSNGDAAATVDLERAIARLPDRARIVFVLHDVEGFRHHEIATMAGMAEGTSKAQLSRARQLLRKALTT
jgi:RNA polymerase sigma-70 factor (ECF subfamily)